MNRIGDDPEGVHYNGKSQMVNARGEILCLAEPDQETVLSFTLDYEALQHFREKFPVGKDWDSFCTHTNHFNHEKNPLS